MNRTALLLACAALLVTGCTARGGGGGGGDDDDDGGGSGTLWLRILDSFAGEDEVRHRLIAANHPLTCASIRAEYETFDTLSDGYNDEYDAIVDEFGDEESPGAQRALCELERDWYRRFLDEDLPSFRLGAVQQDFSFYSAEAEWGDELPPGGYLHGDDADGESYYYGSSQRVASLDWLQGWEDVDCSEEGAADAYFDEDTGIEYAELQGGTAWVSAPSANARGLTTEDMREVDEDTGSSAEYSLDDTFPLCELDQRE